MVSGETHNMELKFPYTRAHAHAHMRAHTRAPDWCDGLQTWLHARISWRVRENSDTWVPTPERLF